MNRRNRSLVIGAEGSIGGTLLTRLTREGVDVQGTCRAKFPPAGCLHLELTDEPRLWLLPDSIGTAYLCAGISPQEACRQDPYGTRLVNVLRTVELAKRLAANGTFVVFLSSSLVFDGSTAYCGPLCSVSPKTEYGRQKAEAEREILSLPRAAVVRLAKVLAPHWPLGRKWQEALRAGQAIHPFSDMVMAPVSIDFAVDVLAKIGCARRAGIYQVSADRDVAYVEAAARLAGRLGASPSQLQPTTAASAGILPESTPCHTTLDAGRLRAEFGLEPPGVWEAIDCAFGFTP
jgi:dTDP-4-dehydrorhamnose reductase